MKIIQNIENSDFLNNIEYENMPEVEAIIKDVKTNGDKAIIKYCTKFNDGNFNCGTDFLVNDIEIENAYKALSNATIESIKLAIANVKNFAAEQFKCIREFELNIENSTLGHKIVPLETVLCYAPGGNYPLPSSAIMTIVPASSVGVKNIILASPKIYPQTIVAAHLSGATKIYKIGGVQALAGFTYGSESLPKVDKIVGPGNKYVTCAKKFLYGAVDIDFLAGPSEVLIVADENADEKLISADILAQCEHDRDARGYLITNSIELAHKVIVSAKKQLENLPTKDVAKIAFENSIAIIVKNFKEAVELSNKRAPEHLELMGKEPEAMWGEFTNYGSLFIGKNCAEVFGDYCSGTNHVLPTNQNARYTGGLSVFDFIKIQTYQNVSSNYAKKLSKISSAIAEQEGLFAHKLASDLRG